MRSATPARRTALMVSPPPMTENACALVTARATPSVPSANGGFSKTPMGPFHTTVRAVRITSAKHATRGRDLLGLHEGATDFVSHGGQKRECHAAADEDRVHALEQVLDERQLVRDLGAPEERHERALGRFENAAERGQLLLHEEAG